MNRDWRPHQQKKAEEEKFCAPPGRSDAFFGIDGAPEDDAEEEPAKLRKDRKIVRREEMIRHQPEREQERRGDAQARDGIADEDDDQRASAASGAVGSLRKRG